MTEPGKAQQPQAHPLRCETCRNTACEYWEESPHMSAGHDEQTGWRASPGVITFAVGCASHTSASHKRIELVIEELEERLEHGKQYTPFPLMRIEEAIALLQAGRK